MSGYAVGYGSLQPIGLDAERVKALNEGYYKRMAEKIAESERTEDEKKAKKEAAKRERELAKKEKKEEKQRQKSGTSSLVVSEVPSSNQDRIDEEIDFRKGKEDEKNGTRWNKTSGQPAAKPVKRVDPAGENNGIAFDNAIQENSRQEKTKKRKSLLGFIRKEKGEEVVVR
jgi:hypothetical protein